MRGLSESRLSALREVTKTIHFTLYSTVNISYLQMGLIRTVADLYKLRPALEAVLRWMSKDKRDRKLGKELKIPVSEGIISIDTKLLRGWGDKSINNLLNAIDESKSIPSDR